MKWSRATGCSRFRLTPVALYFAAARSVLQPQSTRRKLVSWKAHAFGIGLLLLAGAHSANSVGSNAAMAGSEDKPPEVSSKPFEEIAEKLTNGLFGLSGCVATSRKTLGIWPFEADKIPIAKAAADQVYDAVLSRLVERRPECADYLDGAGVGAIITYLHRTGALSEAGGNPVVALQSAQRKVDVIVIGRIFMQGGEAFVSYKALERESGKLLVQTVAMRLPPDYIRGRPEDTAQPLLTVLQRAARYFVNHAHDMTELWPGGIYYQDGGAQPPFARYVAERLSGAMSREYSNMLTGKILVIKEPSLRAGLDRGISVTPQDLEVLPTASANAPSGVYYMTGRYWVFQQAIDLRITLRNQKGQTLVWSGRIRRDDVDQIELEPSKPIVEFQGADQGTFTLQLTTPRGPNPTYREGERLKVLVRAGKDAWLYCFYMNAKGQVIQIIPNRFQRDRRLGHFVKRGVLYTIPDPKRDRFRFQFDYGVTGQEMLKCYAVTKDVMSALPAILQGREFKRLPAHTALRLTSIFSNLEDAKMSKSSLIIAVEENNQ